MLPFVPSLMTKRCLQLTIVLGMMAVAIGACRGLPDGPSLADVTVGTLSLASTTGNSGLCCCRVVGQVTNQNDVAIHATLKLTALDSRGESIETILYFVPDLEPGATRDVDAHGFIVPCDAISQLTTEVDVKGITFPPL